MHTWLTWRWRLSPLGSGQSHPAAWVQAGRQAGGPLQAILYDAIPAQSAQVVPARPRPRPVLWCGPLRGADSPWPHASHTCKAHYGVAKRETV